MKQEYIQNYFNAFKSVLETFISNKVEFERLDKRNLLNSSHDIIITIEFVGDYNGTADFIMDKEVAISLSSILAGGMELTEIDELVKSAMGEFGNMVMGNTCTLFSGDGITLDITPPTINTDNICYSYKISPAYYNNIAIERIGNIGLDIALAY